MKIGFFNIRSEDEQQYFQTNLPNHELFLTKESLSKENPPTQTDFEILSVFTDSKLDSEVLKNFPNLKYIVARSTGFDHIDLNYCSKNNIQVSNVPTYGENTVAEYTFALILSLVKKIPQTVEKVKQTEKFDREGLTGIDLEEKTLGVIGTGHIGSHSIEIAQGFGMKILAFDAFPNNELSQKLGFNYVSLDELLEKSDIITLHVPYLKETHHLLNSQNMPKIKKGAILINTSRGEIIETASLVKALEENIISQAALDVLENEDALRNIEDETEEDKKISELNNKLMDMENVFITPHNASNTKEAKQRIYQTSVENIKSFLEGNPKNLVQLKNS